ncbi:hypothetical protein SIN8267_00230 [Sinobacterium norvegicum]|uniref:Type VI secretion system-associated protein TagF n=1 Tax=Sinobacterium norvegicum TaxID=1641715 RepID=A0ABM9AAY5_9GAMM|nr:type VI secretion system-associated protein TagF [Sinobacterium norvegicum]CAH0990145.1 hypothetical protein SIN8267_00230 [Sinobacterium norvegicum]
MNAGIFGKLPSHGDFVDRNLPVEFRNNWCQWLQHVLTVSREELQEQWLNHYLNSHSWRFALSEGVLDQNAWAGVIIPSVDSVGRYFPFAIAQQLVSNNIYSAINQSGWFDAIEAIAISALDPKSSIQQIEQKLISQSQSLNKRFDLVSDNKEHRLNQDNNISDLTTSLLYRSSNIKSSQSIWHNKEKPEKSFIYDGLPCGSTFSKMII